MDQSRLEWSRQMMSRSVLTTQLPHSVYIVHLWTTYEHQGRSNYSQHGPCVTYINRVAIQQRLLVKFSCNPHINSLLRALLPCVIIGLCVQWLPQYHSCYRYVIIFSHCYTNIYILEHLYLNYNQKILGLDFFSFLVLVVPIYYLCLNNHYTLLCYISQKLNL